MVSYKQTLKTAVRSLKNNKSRSLLTILGIVIGIAAIIIVMSIGQGTQELILSQIQGLGSNTIVILPGRQPEGPANAASLFLDSLKDSDVISLKNRANVPYAVDVIPMSFGAVRSVYGNETYQTTILGAAAGFENVFNLSTQSGFFFSDDDVHSKSNVAVIGQKVKEELFPFSDPLHKKIRINDYNFRIIGILPEKGSVSLFNFDNMIIAPYSTVGQYVLGRKYFDRIVVLAESEEFIDQTVSDIEITLRQNHNITNPDKDDFYIETQAGLMESISSITTILSVLLTSIAAISLIVGGVGIMNIMLVSVTERTREIGLRKAIGAESKDIMIQFLTEAILLTGFGGLIGMILGFSFSLFIAFILNTFLNLGWPYLISFPAVILGLTVSAAVGIIFGLYPARQAALKSPIEALRYE